MYDSRVSAISSNLGGNRAAQGKPIEDPAFTANGAFHKGLFVIEILRRLLSTCKKIILRRFFVAVPFTKCVEVHYGKRPKWLFLLDPQKILKAISFEFFTLMLGSPNIDVMTHEYPHLIFQTF